ncbi:PAS domain-containing protein [Sphingomonas sp. AP4-R1]|uniref:sensor histidine kinase n=1 Tax=Sphingomonas sp. AP4-R1 TaxID=2735134 RepID=UPI0014937FBC|nr:ATP-binding protein [Sphingomonas sp. AP4-R1]QJU57980.1 PAS domain-containing protein [Sphingomonas sp. AP4-R1]
MIWIASVSRAHLLHRHGITLAVEGNDARVRDHELYVARTLDAVRMAMDHVFQLYGEALIAGARSPSGPIFLGSDPVLAGRLLAGTRIASGDGRIIAAVGRSPTALPADLLAWMGRAPMQDGRLLISPPFRDPATGAERIYAIRRFMRAPDRTDRTNRILAIVPMAPAALLGVTGDAWGATNTDTVIIGDDGIVRARMIGDRVVPNVRLSGAEWAWLGLGPGAWDRIRHGDAHGRHSGEGGRDHVARSASFHHARAYPLIVASAVGHGATLNPFHWFGRVHLAGALTRTIAVLAVAWLAFRAIDAQVRRELALAENNRRLLVAQMMGRMGEWSWDAATDTVWRSPVLDWLYGDRGRQRKKLADILPGLDPEDRRRVEEAFHVVMATGEPCEFQRRGGAQDGGRRVRRVIAYPTRNAEGTIIGVHGIDQDVTTAKRLESLESRIVQLSRLDAMHLMAATLAHEINQPLAAAANYLVASRRLLARPGTAPHPEIEDLILSGETQVRNAGQIVRRVREMVMKRDEHVPIVVSGAWHRAAELVEAVTEDRAILFETEIDEDAAMVIADEVQLSQVFTNLMRNAVEAVPAGPVLIGLRVRRDDKGCVRLDVRDNGSGVAMPDHDVFAPLETTKESGFGLGLIISRTIVEAHGGRIWIESSGAEGTVVAFTLQNGVP